MMESSLAPWAASGWRGEEGRGRQLTWREKGAAAVAGREGGGDGRCREREGAAAGGTGKGRVVVGSVGKEGGGDGRRGRGRRRRLARRGTGGVGREREG